YRTEISLILLDIDHFKKFNDTWGHQVGDLVLQETAQRIIESIRAVDTPGRYGGEEMVVILPQTGPKDALMVSERIRTSIANAVYKSGGQELKVTVSIGVTSLSGRTVTLEGFIEECDKALYKAKDAGRNRVVQSEQAPDGSAS
ncbi:MAG TPA: GGDEF domain-containing protein, partial [Candidatus Ozemobacteraceae bacterium]|nr:GGDEF domain-containing protein [Candidatus Ozemobacteraceae bacterium]